jgi:hypothetical protein
MIYQCISLVCFPCIIIGSVSSHLTVHVRIIHQSLDREVLFPLKIFQRRGKRLHTLMSRVRYRDQRQHYSFISTSYSSICWLPLHWRPQTVHQRFCKPQGTSYFPTLFLLQLVIGDGGFLQCSFVSSAPDLNVPSRTIVSPSKMMAA